MSNQTPVEQLLTQARKDIWKLSVARKFAKKREYKERLYRTLEAIEQRYQRILELQTEIKRNEKFRNDGRFKR